MAIGLLLLSSGALWTATYILIIRQGVLDGAYGMPLVALCANLAWEVTFALAHPDVTPQRAITGVWLALDLAILFQMLRYGPREFPELGRRGFYALVALSLGTSFGVVLLLSRELNDTHGAYGAFGQSLLMSALFVGMLLRRRSLKGQSLAIAVCKLLGTGCASLAFLQIMPESLLLRFLYLAILGYDLLYLGLVVGLRGRAAAARAAPAPSPLFTPRVPPAGSTPSGLPWYREN